MEYHDYERQVQQAAALDRNGDRPGARALFETLAEDRSLPDMDRNIMFYNAALLSESVDPPEQTEGLYDRAADLERPWHRARAREGKAAWLERIGRPADAAAIYTELLGEGWLLLAERRKYEEAVFRTRP